MRITLGCALILSSTPSLALDVNSTLTANHLSQMVTGGTIPTSSATYTTMVTQIAAGNLQAAAQTAATSIYFCNYLARRLAYQMQNPSLTATGGLDNDATTYLVAHFCGGAATSTPGTVTKPSISTIWSENATYTVSVNGTNTRAMSLTLAQNQAANWAANLVQTAGQTANAFAAANASTPSAQPVTIPASSTGGYLTLSSALNDNSFAQYGGTAGTNLRYIEGMWEIATGFALLDAASTIADPTVTPRFVPEYDPNFFVGVGQPACISCHGGGFASIEHGYATVADIFDYNASEGLTYNSAPTTNTMKSLGSMEPDRAATSTCNLSATPTPVCNPDSIGIGTAQAWDVTNVWSSSGFLAKLGWTGPTSGTGLNALGAALGKSNIVYQFLTERIVNEICPMGSFTQIQVNTIANAANPFASPAGTDDVRTIVAMVASDSSCQ
jgi:hypothetical protein